jgi:hypothetical protein
VGIDLRDIHPFANDDRRRDSSLQLRLPERLRFVRHRRAGGSAAKGVMSVGRPVARRVSGGSNGLAECGPGHQALRDVGGSCRRRVVDLRVTGLLIARQCQEPLQFDSGVTETVVGRHVQQPVAGHETVMAHGAEPIVAHVLFTLQVDEFHAPFGQQQKPVSGLAAVAAKVMQRADQVLDLDGLPDFACPQIQAFAMDAGPFPRMRSGGVPPTRPGRSRRTGRPDV